MPTLYGKQVSEGELTEAVVDTLLHISRKHPGNVFFGQSTIRDAMFYKKREIEGSDWHGKVAGLQQIKEILDEEARKEDKERRVSMVIIPHKYGKDNFNGSVPIKIINHYRSRFEYVVDLRKIEGRGNFPCQNPACEVTIDPDDLTTYEVIEEPVPGSKIVSCGNCQSKTKVIDVI